MNSSLRFSLRPNPEVIRERRPLGRRVRTLLERFQTHRNGLMELRAPPGSHRLGIEFDLDVRRHAAVLHFPFAGGKPDGNVRGRDGATVKELWIARPPSSRQSISRKSVD